VHSSCCEGGSPSPPYEDRGSAIDEGVDEQVPVDGVRSTIHEITTSCMFSLDGEPDVADAEKVRYIHEAQANVVPRSEAGRAGGLDRLRFSVKVSSLTFS
jgi:hypothetical protein